MKSEQPGLLALGLDRLATHLPSTWPALTVGPVRRLLGHRDAAGSARAVPSSAAALTCGEHTVFLPAPQIAAEPGLAPVYLHADRAYVLPHFRQFVTDPDAGDPEYLSLSHWLEDAFTRWHLPSEPGPIPVSVVLARCKQPTAEALHLLALLVRYALLGSDRPFRRDGLTFPRLPLWLRPLGANSLAQATARQLVLTVRLRADDSEARQTLPTTDLRAAGYRITPAEPRDWGLDPVHTPEGADIRLLGRLGQGVTVTPERGLRVPAGEPVPLSLSTGRIPFAGHDDPRRLLMAANMQLQAMPLLTDETPRVRATPPGIDPPGTNLTVAYLAWQGLNHEDAWVISESAARKLTAVRDTEWTVLIRTVEAAPRWEVGPGDRVQAGQRLLTRFVVPALLTDDLTTLALLPDLLDVTPLTPEPGDVAPVDGEVIAREQWDLHSGVGVPDDVEIPDDVRAAIRSVHRIVVRETLPLEIGDKLANRHGHKGIVGMILPDAAMPTLDGVPVEALIDPISVLNRSNWGQLHECQAGRGSDTVTARLVLPAESPLRETTSAVGPQFVLRLPQLAREKATLAPLARARSTLRYRPQRLGEMEHWALWAHGGAGGISHSLRPEAAELQRLLRVAGIEMVQTERELLLRALDLSVPLADDVPAFDWTDREQASSKRLGVRSLRELYDQLGSLEMPAHLRLPEPLVDVPTPLGLRELRWLLILPAADRPPRRLHDGSEQAHDLTLAYRRILRLLRPWLVASRKAEATADEDEETADATLDLAPLQQAVGQLMHLAYTRAVGRRATGQDSNKVAHLRRQVLGRRLKGSARAVVAPSGPLGLALDEIGLPEVLFDALLGAEAGDAAPLWLKRDPVLHRFGLLAVRARRVPGHAIRLPASLLGPLGADFDGDTVALFATIPGQKPGTEARPQSAPVHDLTGAGLFLPGKQYIFGLSRLEVDAPALATFQAALAEAGAPAWPSGEKNTAARLRAWLARVSQKRGEGPADPTWWGLLERWALVGLAGDPGMGLTLPTVSALPQQCAVVCGAAKNLYDDATGLQLADEFLSGRSLARYRRHEAGAASFDPIAEVMVAARNAIGRFGGALRRLVYGLPTVTPRDLRLAQTLTEQTTQKALSVKAGQPPVSVQAFEAQLRRLLQGELWDLPADDDLARILEPMRAVWQELAARFTAGDRPAWLQWLQSPEALSAILTQQGEVRLPLDDVRGSVFVQEAGTAP